MCNYKIAEVIVNSSVRQLGKIFHYEVPDHIISDIKIGQVVSVPFGKGNRKVEGFVIGFTDKSPFEELKPIEKILVKEKLFKEELINLAFWMSEQYLCSVADCLKIMLPPLGKTKVIKEENLYVKLLKSPQEIIEEIKFKKVKGKKQIEVLEYLISNGNCFVSEILKKCTSSYHTVRSLEKKGLIKITEEIIDKSPLKNKVFEKSFPFIPNKYQQEAINKILQFVEERKPAEVLIHGVTGSGKTEVYLQIISEVLKKGLQAIVLVPEISLTPQMIERFVGRFGYEVAVLHSKLSEGERRDQWYKIREGKVNVVIGARSAVFAPFERLGIIIIDEEHEHTYKSENTPRYHAHDIARKRSELENCVVVLGSATPAVETYYKALNGEINLVELPERVNEGLLPEIEIVDMRKELTEGNRSIFSRRLYNLMKENIKNNNQTILFLNRRGYSSFVLCRNCGYIAKCRFCNISLTYHLDGDKLLCHYCGYAKPNFEHCPSCGSKFIKHFGIGTQKLEEEVRKYFSEASILRMDFDTTSRKNSHEEILKKFKEENINILIGTQMVAKGHDFPNVTLVGIISADLMLNIEDFRSTERTFQLLTQAAGRAGRAAKPGKVIIQTYEIGNFSIKAAKAQDYLSFYNQEIILRKELNYPPFVDIISILISGYKESRVIETANKIGEVLKKELLSDDYLEVFDPISAPISKINNRFRWRIIIKCKLNPILKKRLNELLSRESSRFSSHCIISIDVNPLNML